ncbi:uncharacterized protein LOC116852140 [Odontomachus brunneus]|uniref:uncharacterized protein LOC116852140 n=1 Tax=Odontomachus brunneus TaxID=486640 RepID=UPI0013F19B20|nr:uncharacterized protein LOC116852140 [Odontomachus brunneus]
MVGSLSPGKVDKELDCAESLSRYFQIDVFRVYLFSIIVSRVKSLELLAGSEVRQRSSRKELHGRTARAGSSFANRHVFGSNQAGLKFTAATPTGYHWVFTNESPGNDTAAAR